MNSRSRQQSLDATRKAQRSGSLVDPGETPARPERASQRPRRKDSAIRVATLVPIALYERIKADHGADGTFGQLITWACQDHPAEVTAEVLETVATPRRISRVSRVVGAGSKEVTRQIAPRFRPEEEAVVAELLDRITQEAVASEADGTDPSKVTRTAVHAAALRAWARNHAPDIT